LEHVEVERRITRPIDPNVFPDDVRNPPARGIPPWSAQLYAGALISAVHVNVVERDVAYFPALIVHDAAIRAAHAPDVSHVNIRRRAIVPGGDGNAVVSVVHCRINDRDAVPADVKPVRVRRARIPTAHGVARSDVHALQKEQNVVP
jgi:hypothetical protein